MNGCLIWFINCIFKTRINNLKWSWSYIAYHKVLISVSRRSPSCYGNLFRSQASKCWWSSIIFLQFWWKIWIFRQSHGWNDCQSKCSSNNLQKSCISLFIPGKFHQTEIVSKYQIYIGILYYTICKVYTRSTLTKIYSSHILSKINGNIVYTYVSEQLT